MSLEMTSHDTPMPEQADTAATEDRTFGSLEDVMSAYSGWLSASPLQVGLLPFRAVISICRSCQQIFCLS